MAAGETCVTAARKFLKARLFAQNPPQRKWEECPCNISTTESRRIAYRTVRNLLEYTILKGEGNSLLIVGPRSAGKTFMLNEVLDDLDSDPRCKGNYLLVKLNGTLHSDDRLALLDIAWQLGLEKDIEDRVALSFSAALDCILQALRSGNSSKKSVVFVLDEFDLFTKHKNQTLLYNLFDLAQSSFNPVAVVGITDRENVVEMFEKRVHSRFSHRIVSIRNDYSLADYTTIFQDLLSLPSNFEDPAYLKKWNTHLQKLVQNPQVKKVLGVYHSLYCNIQSLKLLLTVPVCKLGDLHPFLLPEDLTSSAGMLSRDYKVDVIRGLSLLGLCLVIASSHVAVVNNFEPFNFEMVFNEYKALTEKSGSSVQLFSKPVVMKAFDNLLHLNVVCPVEGGTAKTMKEFKLMELNILEDQVKEAVKTYRECPRDVVEWAMRRGCRD